MEALIRTYQLWAGIKAHVLTDTQLCPWIPDSWLSHLRSTMQMTCITITYHSWTIPPLCNSDRYLMDNFLDYGLPRFKLECLNACQMYLKVTTLLEITDHTGTELLPQILSNPCCQTPKGLDNISYSLLQWLQIHLPLVECWQLWSSTVQTIYTGLTRGTKLLHPLGDWLTMHTLHHFWNWQMHDESHLVYKHSANAQTRVALPTQHHQTYLKFTPTVPMTLPFDGPPVTPLDTTTGLV